LAHFSPKFDHETEWLIVEEMVRKAILTSGGESRRNSKILGPHASTLLSIVTIVSMELTRPGPRFQTFDGSKMLLSLFHIGLTALDELYGGEDDARDLYFQEMRDLKARFDSAMDLVSTEFLTKRGRPPPKRAS